MYFKLMVFFVSVLYVHAELNGTCTTPNGEKATCLPFFSCPVVYKSDDQTFMELSMCNKDGEAPYVCCGQVGTFNDDSFDVIFGIFQESAEGMRLPSSVRDKNDASETIITKEIDSIDLPNRKVCGIHAVDDRIYGGDWTAYDEFPWVVPLVYENQLENKTEDVRCAGSIINNKFVLTSARCTFNFEFKLIAVHLGEWNLTSDPDCSDCDPVKVVKIAEIIRHPNYGETSKNDIALLRLEKDIEYSDFIRPVCLPPEDLPDPKEGTELVVSGWGATNYVARSDIKLKASVPFVTNEKCREDLPQMNIHDNDMCAGGVDGRDACKGDAGGPLLRRLVDMEDARVQWYQEGIVSRGVACGRVGYPGVYTKVKSYTSWIVENIKSK